MKIKNKILFITLFALCLIFAFSIEVEARTFKSYKNKDRWIFREGWTEGEEIFYEDKNAAENRALDSMGGHKNVKLYIEVRNKDYDTGYETYDWHQSGAYSTSDFGSEKQYFHYGPTERMSNYPTNSLNIYGDSIVEIFVLVRFEKMRDDKNISMTVNHGCELITEQFGTDGVGEEHYAAIFRVPQKTLESNIGKEITFQIKFEGRTSSGGKGNDKEVKLTENFKMKIKKRQRDYGYEEFSKWKKEGKITNGSYGIGVKKENFNLHEIATKGTSNSKNIVGLSGSYFFNRDAIGFGRCYVLREGTEDEYRKSTWHQGEEGDAWESKNSNIRKELHSMQTLFLEVIRGNKIYLQKWVLIYFNDYKYKTDSNGWVCYYIEEEIGEVPVDEENEEDVDAEGEEGEEGEEETTPIPDENGFFADEDARQEAEELLNQKTEEINKDLAESIILSLPDIIRGTDRDTNPFTDVFDDIGYYITGVNTTVDSDAENKLVTKLNPILGVITNIGMVIAVLMSAIIGIKYMLGSVEEKAEYKNTLVPYLVGSILLFGLTTIIKALQLMGQNINNI